MQEAYQAALKAGMVRTAAIALTHLGRIRVLSLDFKQAEAYYVQASDVELDGQNFLYDMALFDLAQLKYEQNELAEARRLVERGLETNRMGGSAEMHAYGLRLAARLAQLFGEREQAWKLLEDALQMGKNLNLSPLSLQLNGAMLVQMALADGRLLDAERGAMQINITEGLYAFIFLPELARVPLLLQQGRRAEALAEIEKGVWRAQQPGWEYPRLQVRVLQALAESSPARANDFLHEALTLAAPVHAVRSFVDLGEPMRALLLGLRKQVKPGESLFLEHVIAAFGPEPAPVIRQAPPEPRPAKEPATGLVAQRMHSSRVEPLSERELEVLRLLAEGLSSAEIAAQLYLSPNTLKAHTQNIYSKLDVHSRVQAINKARESGFI